MNTLDDLITNTNTGSNAFWQIMGRFMDKNTKSLTIPPLNISGDNFAYTDLEKANALIDYFCSISTVDDTYIRLSAFQRRTNSTLSHITILESKIADILRTLQINKAVGPDSWLVGCFGFKGPLRQYFSLYRAVSQREGERGEKG